MQQDLSYSDKRSDHGAFELCPGRVFGLRYAPRVTTNIRAVRLQTLDMENAFAAIFAIEWDDVASLTSNQNIQVETEGGDRYLRQSKSSMLSLTGGLQLSRENAAGGIEDEDQLEAFAGLSWEMIEDLFWELSFYDSFDSDPAVRGAEENDYGIVTSLGWEF